MNLLFVGTGIFGIILGILGLITNTDSGYIIPPIPLLFFPIAILFIILGLFADDKNLVNTPSKPSTESKT